MHYYFITGTSYGLGKALAEALLTRPDVFVYGIARTCSIEHASYKHLFIDLSDPDEVERVLPLLTLPSDAVSGTLINNAGSIEPIHHFGSFSSEDIQQLMQINLIAPVQLMNAFIKMNHHLSCRRIVMTISSGAAHKVTDGWALYGAAKASLDHVSRHIKKEAEIQKAANLFVFSIAPGVIDTSMQKYIRQCNMQVCSQVDRFIHLHKENLLESPQWIASKFLRVLDVPENYPESVFSMRDLLHQ